MADADQAKPVLSLTGGPSSRTAASAMSATHREPLVVQPDDGAAQGGADPAAAPSRSPSDIPGRLWEQRQRDHVQARHGQ